MFLLPLTDQCMYFVASRSVDEEMKLWVMMAMPDV